MKQWLGGLWCALAGHEWHAVVYAVFVREPNNSTIHGVPITCRRCGKRCTGQLDITR